MGRPRGSRKKERYYVAAKKHGYRARSAYKLKQISQKHGLLKGVEKVLELCSAPGGWTQVLLEMDKGLRIVAVDLSPQDALENVTFIQGDITNPDIIKEIEEKTGGSVNLVLSDCSPKVSGNWELDVARQLSLAEATMNFGHKFLSEEGKVLAKVFQGSGFQEFLKDVRKKYKSTKLVKPDASRRTSAEIYLLATGPIHEK